MSHEVSQSWLEADGELSRRFMVYLPSRTKDGIDITTLEQISDCVAEMLRQRFGGATRYPAIGYFGNQKEKVVAIECYCTRDDWSKSSKFLCGVMQALGYHLDQESIACSLDGRMELVEPSENQQILKEILSIGPG